MQRDIILVVDDIEVNRIILKNIFELEYKIIEAENGKKAVELLMEYGSSVSVVLLDIVMPELDGFGVLQEMAMLELLDYVPVILITDKSNEEIEKNGYDLGVSDVIWKPFDSYVVNCRVRNMIELYRHKNHLEFMLKVQTKKIEAQAKKLRDSSNVIIDVLSNIVEFRDLESGGHINQVRNMTEILLTDISANYPEYHLSPELIRLISSASVTHDIGKIAIPDTILLKPDRLTKEEFDVMKTHTLRGCEIMESIGQIQETEYYSYCYSICRSHHERYDGKGYPDGLEGENIPIAAQVVGLADVYDALVSQRVNKEAFSTEKAYLMVLAGECGAFSERLLRSFKNVKKKLEALV